MNRAQYKKKQKYHTAHCLSQIHNLFWLIISLFRLVLEEVLILFFLATLADSEPDAVDHVLVDVHLHRRDIVEGYGGVGATVWALLSIVVDVLPVPEIDRERNKFEQSF